MSLDHLFEQRNIKEHYLKLHPQIPDSESLEINEELEEIGWEIEAVMMI